MLVWKRHIANPIQERNKANVTSHPTRPNEVETTHHNTHEVILCAQKPLATQQNFRGRSRVLFYYGNVKTIDFFAFAS